MFDTYYYYSLFHKYQKAHYQKKKKKYSNKSHVSRQHINKHTFIFLRVTLEKLDEKWVAKKSFFYKIRKI